MVSRCMAKEVQRNAKWGVFDVDKESGRGGKVEWARWKRKVGEVESESW